jgi:hypothetical protein
MGNRLTVEELAHRWLCTEHKLYQWRSRKTGVKHYKEDKIIYYDLSDVEEYERKNWSVRGVPMR